MDNQLVELLPQSVHQLITVKTMATSLVQLEELHAAVNSTADKESRGGLTADPDALSAVFDSVERSIAGNVRSEEFVKKSLHVSIVFHNLPRH